MGRSATLESKTSETRIRVSVDLDGTGKSQVKTPIGFLTHMVEQIARRIVGHRDLIEGILACLLCSGHVLLEGVPGLAKTLAIKSLASAIHAKFNRIQFTPDLMPADIIGTTVISDDGGKRDMVFRRGPLFANIVLADEINRAPPKTQAAMLEAMQERKITVGGAGLFVTLYALPDAIPSGARRPRKMPVTRCIAASTIGTSTYQR